MLDKTPHIYVIGNQPEFATDVMTSEWKAQSYNLLHPPKLILNLGEDGGRRTRIILLPRFSQSGCLTLVNAQTLEVKTVSFKVSGM